MDFLLVRIMNEYKFCIIFHVAPLLSCLVLSCSASPCLARSSVMCAGLHTHCLDGDPILLGKQAAARVRSANQSNMNRSLFGEIGEVRFGGHGLHSLGLLN